MNSLFRRFLLFFVVVQTTLTACVQPADIEPSGNREVFVKCILMNDTVQQVRLLYSGSIDAETFPPVTDAEVYIEASTHLRLVFKPAGNSVWESDFRPKPGVSYTLHVKIPGRDEITATTTFPEEFSVIPKRSVPVRWVADMRAIRERSIPGAAGVSWNFLLPSWIGTFRQYIPQWDEVIHNPEGIALHSAIGDLNVLSRIAEYGGTTIQQEMPGMAFRIEAESTVLLYVAGTVIDEQGTLSRIKRLGTNHRRADRSNLLPEEFRSGVDPQQASATLPLDPTYRSDEQYKNPLFRKTYDKAILYAYEGQPVFADYLRIIAKPDYDNGMKLYTILEGNYHSFNTDSSAIVKPPYQYHENEPRGPYYLEFEPDGARWFSVYGDFEYNIWGENGTNAHPSLYFCSVSEEYDRYMQSLRSFKNEQGDMLVSLYRDIRNVYTNIDGGHGVFGAALVLRHDCDCHYTYRQPIPNGPGYDWYYDYAAYPAPLPEL